MSKISKEQHAFTAKINARIKALVKEFGLNKSDIIDQLGIDGVGTTKAGNLTIDPNQWSTELAKRINESILTVTNERNNAINRLKNFIGPLHKNDIRREVQAKFSIEDAWEDIREKYYEIEDLLAQVDSDIIARLAKFGSDFNAEEVSYTDLLNFRDQILEDLDNAF